VWLAGTAGSARHTESHRRDGGMHSNVGARSPMAGSKTKRHRIDRRSRSIAALGPSGRARASAWTAERAAPTTRGRIRSFWRGCGTSWRFSRDSISGAPCGTSAGHSGSWTPGARMSSMRAFTGTSWTGRCSSCSSSSESGGDEGAVDISSAHPDDFPLISDDRPFDGLPECD